MNSNLQRQEDCIKKTVKKTIAEEHKKPPIQVLPPEPPEQPPRPPLPKNIPIQIAKMDKSSPKNAKKVAINPSPRCEIFGFFSSRSLKTRENYISFAHFVCFLREVWKKNIIVNSIIQELKSKHVSLKKYTNWVKLTEQN